MHYINNTRNVYAIASVFMLFCFAFLGVSAQTIDTDLEHDGVWYIQDNHDISEDDDSLFDFFFYMQESYFGSHLMYGNDLRKMLKYGETIFPNTYQWVLENINDFKVENDNYRLNVFHKDSLLSSFNHDFNPQDFSTYIFLRNFVRLFDKDDLVIQDSNIKGDYESIKRKIDTELCLQGGYEYAMQKVIADTGSHVVKTYPLIMVFIYEDSVLRPHPLFADYEEQYHSGEYEQRVVSMAASLCSKYKAEKIIFSVPVIYR